MSQASPEITQKTAYCSYPSSFPSLTCTLAMEAAFNSRKIDHLIEITVFKDSLEVCQDSLMEYWAER
ncbi:hypothetical protein CEXT_439731 [Caerostris extrusa]|uniref:Uncharacterized protein n=1 Tax=Caerostris extrusa TaxID=172846 RepID=A0AAV4SHU6_CAEEX|nr:hypothetical protein CEXT_439731 [Caerostris extrusa]